jgi:hypothetical protein
MNWKWTNVKLACIYCRVLVIGLQFPIHISLCQVFSVDWFCIGHSGVMVSLGCAIVAASWVCAVISNYLGKCLCILKEALMYLIRNVCVNIYCNLTNPALCHVVGWPGIAKYPRVSVVHCLTIRGVSSSLCPLLLCVCFCIELSKYDMYVCSPLLIDMM